MSPQPQGRCPVRERLPCLLPSIQYTPKPSTVLTVEQSHPVSCTLCQPPRAPYASMRTCQKLYDSAATAVTVQGAEQHEKRQPSVLLESLCSIIRACRTLDVGNPWPGGVIMVVGPDHLLLGTRLFRVSILLWPMTWCLNLETREWVLNNQGNGSPYPAGAKFG